MPDIKPLSSDVEQLASRFVLADLSVPAEFDAVLKEISGLRSDPRMKPLTDVSRMIVSAVAAVGMYKKTDTRKCADILSCLLSALQQALCVLDRSGDASELVKIFNEDIKRIVSSVKVSPSRGISESQAREIPGFIASTLTSLDDTEKSLLILEKEPENSARIDELFRFFHTVKGEANLLGFGHVALLAHTAEDFLGLLRDRTLKFDEQITSVFLQAVDALRRALAQLKDNPSFDPGADMSSVIENMKALRLSKQAVQSSAPVGIPPQPVAGHCAQEIFVPQVPVLDLSNGADLFVEFANEGFDHLVNSERSVLVLETTPDDKEAINNIFRAFHTIKGAAAFLDLRDIRVFSHEAETMLDMVRKDTLVFGGRVVELTLASIDLLRKMLELLQEQAVNAGQLKSPYVDCTELLGSLKEVISGKKQEPVGEILLRQGAVTQTELAEALFVQKEISPQKKVGEILVEAHAASTKQVSNALEVQKTGAAVENTIKIQLDKLDSLIDLVGELVISETQVIQSPFIHSIEDQKFHKNLGELDRITRRLQQIAMGMRLVQVGPTFQKMVRLVRDLSKKLGKEISITLSGEETEIDKNMVELVGDPLMHMVRNSVDHGIESREVRVAAGKNPAGKVQLSAYHRGGSIVIEIKDDGGGLRKDRILAKAVERGLVKPGEELSDKRIFNLIFEPGFSTAEKVTDVSGRGVGMDVVKKNIEKLRGRVEIESQVGQGSTFFIYLPITLAIIEGIVVEVGNEKYILPINSVIEFVKPDEKSLTLIYGRGEMYSVYGKVYPLIRLGKLFGVPCGRERFEDATVCIIESEYGRACVLVDELLGQQQVVIKSLGDNLRKVQGVSGAAILGDGRVGLILDVNGLVCAAAK